MRTATPSRSDAPAGRSHWAGVQALVVLAALTGGVVALAILSPGQLDAMPGLCVWSRITGAPCPACGTTHALCALLHGDPVAAWGYNRNVVLVAPVLAWVWVDQARRVWRYFRPVAPPTRPAENNPPA